MQFHLIDGKMTCVESKSVTKQSNVKIGLSSIDKKKTDSKKNVITWSFPNEPIVNAAKQPKRNLMDVPMMPFIDIENKSKMGFVAKSTIAAGATSVALMSTVQSGMIWDAFITYIYPWFLQVAKVFCIIKIGQTMYQNHGSGMRGGGESSNFGAMLSWGKWYAIFLFLPFFVELIEGASRDMLNQIKK